MSSSSYWSPSEERLAADRPPEWRLSPEDFRSLLCDLTLALTDYNSATQADKYDKTVFDKELASTYQEILDGLGSDPSLKDVADISAVMPEMLPHIKRYCKYPEVTLEVEPSPTDLKGKGKGKEPALGLTDVHSGMPGRSSREIPTDWTEPAGLYARLTRMLEVRKARKEAFAELGEGDRTDIEDFVVTEEADVTEQSDAYVSPAIILRSILQEQTSLWVNGSDIGCLFTLSHADQIYNMKELCQGLVASVDGVPLEKDGKAMSEWINDLFNLFGRAVDTPAEEFVIDDGSETGSVCEEPQTSRLSFQPGDWVTGDPTLEQIEAMFAAMDVKDIQAEHSSGP